MADKLNEINDDKTRFMQPMTPPQQGYGVNTKGPVGSPAYNQKSSSKRAGFFQNLTQLFGFRQNGGKHGVEFVKVDQGSELKIAQAKIGKTFNTKLVGKLESLFDSWLQDTTDTYLILLDRSKRIAELEFALANDPFLSQAADLYADEATQTTIKGNLIEIDCADARQKSRMEDLLSQWGVTQNRLRSTAFNLTAYGDAFWSNAVGPHGVSRIAPLGIHQVKERLEFNPVQVQTDLELRKGYINTINRSAKMAQLFDTLEDKENSEFADLFDTRLFGFALSDEMVVPPWTITHFRLNVDQSEFFPHGRPVFLKALAPFRQCNATMVLQSLARVMSFPVTVYTVKTAPGMDEALQFDRINQVREEYEAIGEVGAGNEAFSVNTKIWAPEGLLTLTMHSPNIDINAVADIEMYQDRVAIASGIPKGYLVQEWGGFGNSAISLVEQFKPFARKVFNVQSAILEGLSNLFRLHFAITGEFDYRSEFALSMKFPNEEASDQRQQSKQASLTLSKDVLDTVASLVGAINDPLPPEVIEDILAKFSFLDPDDIKRWMKPNPNQKEETPDESDEFGGDMGGGGLGGGGGMGMGGPDIGGAPPAEAGAEAPAPEAGAETPFSSEGDLTGNPQENRRKSYVAKEREILRENLLREKEVRNKKILKRFEEGKSNIYKSINERYSKELRKLDETTQNDRHYKYAQVEHSSLAMYELLKKMRSSSSEGKSSLREETISTVLMNGQQEEQKTWSQISQLLREGKGVQEESSLDNQFNMKEPEEDQYEGSEQEKVDLNRKKKILSTIS